MRGSQRGFTLVEILFAAAVMGIIIVGAATFFAEQIKTATYLRSLNGLFSLQHDLQVTISNSNMCTPAFNGQTIDVPLPKPQDEPAGTIWASDVNGQAIQLTVPGTAIAVGSGDVPSYDLKNVRLFLSNGTQLPDDPSGNHVFTAMVSVLANSSGGAKSQMAPRPVGMVNLVTSPVSKKVVSCMNASQTLHQDPKLCKWYSWGAKGQGGSAPDGVSGICPVGQYAAGIVGTGVTTGGKRDFGALYCCPP